MESRQDGQQISTTNDQSLQELKEMDCVITVREWLQAEMLRLESESNAKQVKRYLNLVNNSYLDRFCNHYKYKSDQVIKGLQSTLQWRQANDIYSILKDFEFKEWELVQKCYPHGYHGLSKNNHPIFIQRLGFIDLDQFKKVTTREPFIKRCFQSFEYSIQVRYKMISQLVGATINKTVIIIDLKEVSYLANNTELMSMLKTMSNISTQHYPGNTVQIYIINIPSLIKASWDILRLAFPDEVTRLMTVLDKNYIEELKKIIDIDNIPHYIGGNCRCEFPKEPRDDLYTQLNLYCTGESIQTKF